MVEGLCEMELIAVERSLTENEQISFFQRVEDEYLF